MVDQHRFLKPREDAGHATAEKGVVILDGPDGVAVTMTAEAAELKAEGLRQAAQQARAEAGLQSREGGDTWDDGGP